MMDDRNAVIVVGEASAPPREEERVDPLSGLISAIVQTKEVREIVASVLPAVIGVWSGNDIIKRFLSKPVIDIIVKGIASRKDEDESRELYTLFRDPVFMGNLGIFIPEIVNGIINVLLEFGKGIEALSPEEAERGLVAFLKNIGDGSTGELITTYLKILNSVYSYNPTVLSEVMVPIWRKWIEKTDFGEMREFFDRSYVDITNLITKMMEELCLYPAKVVTLMSHLPVIANIVVHLLKELLGQISLLFHSPDMITDFMLEMFRQIDAKKIGGLVNVLGEMVRQMHTGSALLGERGAPLFPRDMQKFLLDMLGAIDRDLFIKARIALAEGKDTVTKSVNSVLRRDPEFLIHYMNSLTATRNLHIRAVNSRMEIIEDLNDDDISRTVAEGLSKSNAHDMAEVVNTVCRLFNRSKDLKPDVFISLVREFVNGLDQDAISETIKWITGNLSDIMKPVGRIIIPQLVKMFCEWARSEGDLYDDQVREAVSSLRSLIQGK